MKTKICTKCKKEKELDFFYNKKTVKDGKTSICKNCTNSLNKKYREENAVNIKESRSKYRLNNIDAENKRHKAWRENNREKIRQLSKDYRKNNKEKISDYSNKYREENKEKIKSINIKYYHSNKDIIKANNKEYRSKNILKEKKRKAVYRSITREIIRKKAKVKIDNLENSYLINMLQQQGFLKEYITTELIEVKQLIIKTKRLCKTSQN